MNIDLTPGTIYTLLKRGWPITDLKPVLQVIDTQNVCKIVLSDGAFHHTLLLAASKHYELVKSQQLKKGSIIRLNKYSVISTVRKGFQYLSDVRLYRHICVIIMDLDLIQSECGIIGDPKPFFPLDQFPLFRPKRLVFVQECGCKREKRKSESMELVEQVTSRIARMTVEKSKEEDDDGDDMNACIEKLEKLGRETNDTSINGLNFTYLEFPMLFL